MTRSHLLVCAGLLLTVALPLFAEPDAGTAGQRPAVLRCAGGIEAGALARDLGDGPRLPLTTISIPAGVIVTVTGRHINIIRRDGTEIRLKGLLPGDVPGPGEEHRPLIRDGEVWVKPEALPALLGRTGSCDPAAPASPTAAPAAFDTFEVPAPIILKPAPRPKPLWQPRALPELPQSDNDEDFAWLQLSPLTTSLGLVRVGALTAPGLRATLQELSLPSAAARGEPARNLDPESPVSRVLSYLTAELDDGRRHYFAGDHFDPLLGFGTGLGFLADISSDLQAGASYLCPADLAGQEEEGQLALEARLRLREGVSLESAVALDGRYRALARLHQPALSLFTSLVHLPDREYRQAWWQQRLLPGLRLVGRLSSATGERENRGHSLGLGWDQGSWHLSVQQDEEASPEGKFSSSAVSALWVRPPMLAALHYRRHQSQGEELEASLAYTASDGRQLALTTLRQADGAFSRLDAVVPLGRGLRARISLPWGPRSPSPEIKLEWKRSRDHLYVLRYGPSYPDSPDGPSGRAVALYAVFPFGCTSPGPHGDCVIEGRVKNDAGEGVSDVVVMLDEALEAVTDASGRFRFEGVEQGVHHLRLDPSRLHADLACDGRAQIVVASPAAPAEAEFLVIRLCQISGSVTIVSAEPSAGQPLAGAQVICYSPDRLEAEPLRATTDEQGRYRFTGLRAGRYVLCLAPDQELAGLSTLAPGEWTFLLQPGDLVSGANFTLRRVERPVVFNQFEAAAP